MTVFIKVKMEILKEFSKEMPKKVKNDDRNNKDIIKTMTDKKYLFLSHLRTSLTKYIKTNTLIFC